MADLNPDDPTDRRQLFSWLWQTYLRSHKKMLALGLLMMAIEGAMLGALAKMLQPMFDTVFVGGQRDMIWWVAGIIMALFVIRAMTSLA
ncbi:MAG: ABC transporter ATP-binding protein, partial [Pseudomonadota bacterium]